MCQVTLTKETQGERTVLSKIGLSQLEENKGSLYQIGDFQAQKQQNLYVSALKFYLVQLLVSISPSLTGLNKYHSIST